jgi:hypothetical protein
MYRDTTNASKNVQRHYKGNKNVQRHYKDTQKCTDVFQRQKAKMHRDRDITKTIIKERDITKTNNDNMTWFRQTFKYNYSEITQKYQIVRYAFRIN